MQFGLGQTFKEAKECRLIEIFGEQSENLASKSHQK
jgi:hypothetical protein